CFFFSSRRRHTRSKRDWSSDVCSSDLLYRSENGSGLTDLDFKTAIREGISKVNIFTDINVAAAKAVSERYTDAGKGLTDLIPSAVEAVRRESEKKMRLFDSVGKG